MCRLLIEETSASTLQVIHGSGTIQECMRNSFDEEVLGTFDILPWSLIQDRILASLS